MSTMIRPTPPALVENGHIHCGFFTEPFRKVNLMDARNLGGPLARPVRWLRLKEWNGFGITHPELFGGIIIQNAKYAASGTVYLYDRSRKRQFDWLVIDSPIHATLPESLWKSQSLCGGGTRRMRFTHDLGAFRHHIHVAIAKSGKNPDLLVDLTLHQDWRRTEPLVVSLPIAPDHHTYTHKSPLHLEGIILIGNVEYRFDPRRDLANLDEQKTFYPYRSAWKWGGFTAWSTEGREIMANFVNQMTPHDEQGEDAMWVDGRLMLLPQPSFTPLPAPGAFRLEDRSGRVRLTFTPDGAKAEKRNFGLISMDYQQAYGRYEGELIDDQGTRHRIADAYGPLEQMRARF